VIDPEREAHILRLHHVEKWKVGTIARQLHMHPSTVQRVLTQGGVTGDRLLTRPSKLDPYVAFIVETLTKYPTLRASRLYEMVKGRGYAGSPAHFRSRVACYRPRPAAEAFLRLRTLPGEQGQVDWAEFGKVKIGNAVRKLYAFVMVLSWSRQVFLRFYLNAAMPCFLRGHVDAFAFFGGVPRVLLYDNLKSAVLQRVEDAIRFNATILALAAHYRYLPRPVAPRRGNEKGRVERAIRYIRDSFFAARSWTDLPDLNAQALTWMEGLSADRRCPGDTTRTVRDAFAEERHKLISLPNNPFPTEEREEVSVGKTPYVRFDLNDYSVPSTHVRRLLTVVATLDTVRVLAGPEKGRALVGPEQVLALHRRSWDRGQTIEDPAHIVELVERKRKAREHRAIDRLHHAVPTSRLLLQDAAERGGNLGALTSGLMHLLNTEGAEALEVAINEAIERGTPHLGAIRHLLDVRRQALGEPPPIAIELPDDPRLKNLVVVPHSLATYDQLNKKPTHEKD
jgi:transposase